MYNVSLPWWAYALMGAGLMLFLGLLTVSVKRNHGVKRSLFASPYILWMILFTLLPCVLIAYYALTDGSGQLTLDNFRAFWDSNHIMRENMRAVAGDEVAATIPGAPSMWTRWSIPYGWRSCARPFPCCWATRRHCSWPTGT